jgi:pimeloyl-ACP methyl ester carboxylesterase
LRFCESGDFMTLKTKRWMCGVVLTLLALAGALALSWASDRSVASLAGRWAAVGEGSRFVNVQGMKVHVRDEGPMTEAPPIVLLHGTGSSLHTWDGWAAELALTRRVIRFDLPGFGMTGPHPKDDYSQEAFAGFVVAALDALGVAQPVVLAGNSLGGQIAFETALRHPRRVSALVLVDSIGYAYVSESVPLAFRIARSPLSPMMEFTLPRQTVALSLRNVYGEPDRVTPALIDRHEELALRTGNRMALVKRLAQEEREWAQFDASRIASIKHPTLILWGGQDRLVPPAYGERFAKDIAGAKLVKFDKLGHVPHEEDAGATVAAVLSFLAGQ